MKTVLLVSLLIQSLSMNAPLNAGCQMSAPPNENAREKKFADYLYPAFIKGVVHFRNGTKQEALLNYHCQDGQMQFLNPRADTLLFTGKYLIDYIEIGERRFVLTEAHSDMEVIGVAGKALLASRTQPETVGNGLSYSGQHYSASEGNAAHVQMVSNQGGHIQWENNASSHRRRIKTTYFLIDRNRIVHPASRRAFLHVYGRNKRQLTHYLRGNRVDFGGADDLRKLLGFCDSLTAL